MISRSFGSNRFNCFKLYRIAPKSISAQVFRYLVIIWLLFSRLKSNRDMSICILLDIERLFNQIVRSEEHTSELQSRENLVCRLLLEKKKKKKKSIRYEVIRSR